MNKIKCRLKGVIFDLDGTLADTKLNFSAICQEVNLPIGTALLEYCAQLKDEKKRKHIFSVIKKHELEGAAQAEWIEGAEKMLTQLNNAHIPMAILTRNMKPAAKITIDKLQIPIKLVLTREDCKPKPDPEGLLMIADHWQIHPNQLVYVGDYKFDLIAAQNAGMSGYLKTNGKNEQFAHLANKVIEHFDQLTALLIDAQ
ncbi:HAD family hydrolase [Aliikangiella sp. IMCC44359]|uniref:HAD family hydrolase n=1 Tax=Aliikangiella sp. IMCC44359 TaxID=3459125 RepID=UPI00403A8D52